MSVGSITTKRASELLEISASSLRAYAQTMETLGYTFNKVDNARQFTQYDLHIIQEAMTRYKLAGGTMKSALHYAIVKEEQGEEVADALPTHEVVTSNNNLESLQEVESHIIQQVTKGIGELLNTNHKQAIQAIQALNEPSEDIEDLKHNNASLQTAVRDTREELDNLKSQNAKLRSELEQLKKMSVWDFRKWKKLQQTSNTFK